MELEIEIAIARLIAGYTEQDYDNCEYYEGLLGDAVGELKNLLESEKDIEAMNRENQHELDNGA